MRYRKKGEEKAIASERIAMLFDLAEKEAKKPDMGRAKRYVALAHRISMRYQIKMPQAYKLRFCRKCGAYLVYGRNASVRTVKGIVSIRCAECGHTRRVPFFREVSERRRIQSASRICAKLLSMKRLGASEDELLREAVNLIHKSNPGFNWTGIYLLKGDVLELHNYVGRPTEHIRIKIGTGICGTAVAQERNINVPDVTKVSNYLACSPETKSEIVVLIKTPDGGILGQIDIDSDRRNAFKKADEVFLQKIADCLGCILG